MRLLLCLALAFPLVGCSHTLYLSDADEHGGTVNLVTNLSHDAAVEKANEHCRQYNLVARITSNGVGSNTMLFVCQPAGPAMTAPPGV